MNKLIILSVVTVLAGAIFAQDPAPGAVKPKLTPAQRAAAIRKRNAKPSGGLLERKVETCKAVIRNRQQRFTATELEAAVARVRNVISYPIFCIGADDAKPADATVEVVFEEKLVNPDLSVLVAPEQGLAYLSAAWLLSDSPDQKTRERRLYLAVFRATVMAVGAGAASLQPCIMSHVRTLRDLDATRLEVPSPDTINVIEEGMKKYGIKHRFLVSYRMACKQGWAPQPTNAVQQAIWDEFHALPTEPITIKPEVKPVKD